MKQDRNVSGTGRCPGRERHCAACGVPGGPAELATVWRDLHHLKAEAELFLRHFLERPEGPRAGKLKGGELGVDLPNQHQWGLICPSRAGKLKGGKWRLICPISTSGS